MKSLRYTLVADGPTDRALMPLLTWLLRRNGVRGPITPQWADLQRLPRRPRGLSERIEYSVDLYPCDLLFVHRDAERQPAVHRVQEIDRAITDAGADGPISLPPAVYVVPVRMQEAWLLFDEAALRLAASNPHGSVALELPRVASLEDVPNPKEILHHLLREASGLSGRRKKNVPVGAHAYRLAELIDDFSPLRVLPAFQLLESDISKVVTGNGWGVRE